MKKVYFILLLALAAVSCHQPEYVAPTANRQGLTSLSAIITDGIYAEQELGRLIVTDPEADLYEIPIPYFYPESSNDETLIYMMELRVQAELQPNWKISPRLGVLDLTEETEIRYALAVCYLALIEEVEKYVRYEPDNPTYIRNTVDSREMYDMAFRLL